MSTEPKEITVTPMKQETPKVSSGKNLNISDMKPEQLKVAIQQEKERRAMISEFVKSELVDGIDYGKIHVAKNCPDRYSCTNPKHFSKNCLFKPGMEKIYSLFGIRSELGKDEVTLSMLDTKNVICYICYLFKGNTLIGEGRGACSTSEKDGNVNTSIKIAEKRSRMDACLNIGFSEFFTQDLDDMPLISSGEQPAASSAASKADERWNNEQEKPAVNPNGEQTIYIRSKKNGTSTSGRDWERVETELGWFFNNAEKELMVGVTYDVEIKGNAITRVIELDDATFAENEELNQELRKENY